MSLMRREIVSAVVCVAAAICAVGFATRAQTASISELTGNWQGTMEVSTSPSSKGQRMVLKVTQAGDMGRASWHGVAYNLDSSSDRAYEGRNTTQMSFEGGVVRFVIAPIGVTYEGRLSADGRSIAGRWTQSGQAYPLTLVRADGDTAWAIPGEDKAMARDADPDWEVVTVRPGDPNIMGSGMNVRGRDIVVDRKTAETMLLFGYGVHKTQIVIAPDWGRSELWDAKGYADVPGQPNVKQFQSMLRKLLVERLGLKFHMEQAGALGLCADDGEGRGEDGEERWRSERDTKRERQRERRAADDAGGEHDHARALPAADVLSGPTGGGPDWAGGAIRLPAALDL